MKGIVLAGGSGSRLWPITKGVSKQLLAIHDKPLVHYPIGTLMLAGIRKILIISTPNDIDSFRRLLGDGKNLGLSFEYLVQQKPEGIAQAFIIAEEFVGDESVALALGDNIFHGVGMGTQLRSLENLSGAHIFAYKVSDPENYGVIEFELNGNVKSITEKPKNPLSHWVVPGLYFYDSKVTKYAKSIMPSSRGELEITSLNTIYLEEGALQVTRLERGTAWLDTGTIENLSSASTYVRILEERQGLKISCLEEIAWRNGWISESQLRQIAVSYGENPYGKYLFSIIDS
jgi:glucose-1-phosphate thymidylyltransferase